MVKDLDEPKIVQPDGLGNYHGLDGNVYKESWITHYQPIVKPKLPVY